MKHTWRVTFFLLLLFLGAQVIGLKITESYISYVDGELVWKDLPSFAGVSFERPDVEPQFSIWYVVFAVLIGTLLILLIVRLGREILWKLWFLFAVVLCLQIAIGAFIPANFSLVVSGLVGWFKVFRPNFWVQNLSELFLYGGLAAIFVPIFNVLYAFILLLVLSVYDMYAVWKSKHMVKLAKFQTKSGVFAGLLVPYSLGKGKVRTAVLGGGDIGFPLIFAGTVLVSNGFLPALVVSLGAGLSLFVLLLLSQKDKFYPAMPFLTLGCSVGYLATFLL